MNIMAVFPTTYNTASPIVWPPDAYGFRNLNISVPSEAYCNETTPYPIHVKVRTRFAAVYT